MRWGVLSPENSGLRGSESRPAGPVANIDVKGQTDDSRMTPRGSRSRFAPRRTESPARKSRTSACCAYSLPPCGGGLGRGVAPPSKASSCKRGLSSFSFNRIDSNTPSMLW